VAIKTANFGDIIVIHSQSLFVIRGSQNTH
jgi:hypothetical protein